VFFLLTLALVGCQPQSDNDDVREATPGDEATVEAVTDTGHIVVADTGEPFCLELVSASDRVLLGEPLTLVVLLRNCSAESVEVRDLLRPEYGLLGVRIAHPQHENEQIYNAPVYRDGRGKGYVELAPGEVLPATVPVYFGQNGWQLDAPGAYTFQADYSVDDVALTSNVVSVQIENPASEAQRSAARTFMSPAAATYYYLGGGDDAGADALRALIAEQPESSWAAYARLGLAIDLANDGNNSLQAESCRSLEESVDEVADDWIIALRGYEALSNCLRESGLESDVSRAREKLVRRHPQAEAILGD
jgi:hypothetical protein